MLDGDQELIEIGVEELICRHFQNISHQQKAVFFAQLIFLGESFSSKRIYFRDN